MATVIRSDAARAARVAASRPAGLVIAVHPTKQISEPVACIGVSVRDGALAKRLEAAITRSLRKATAAPLRDVAVVRVRSPKSVERLAGRVMGAIAVIPVTSQNVRRLAETVDALLAAGVAGIQIAWDGHTPSRDVAEARIFAILERARGTGRAPVVLARGEEPAEALRILVDLRSQARPPP